MSSPAQAVGSDTRVSDCQQLQRPPLTCCHNFLGNYSYTQTWTLFKAIVSFSFLMYGFLFVKFIH